MHSWLNIFVSGNSYDHIALPCGKIQFKMYIYCAAAVRETLVEGIFDILGYASWGQGEPNDVSNPKNCVYLSSADNYNWYDGDCNDERPTLCVFGKFCFVGSSL